MASSSATGKRKFHRAAPISPPRKKASTTTKTAVDAFFTPASQKPPPKVTWHERAPNDDMPNSLIVGKYVSPLKAEDRQDLVVPEPKRHKVAAFDFDSTLIKTLSGNKFAKDASDWKWWHSSVPSMLRKLYSEDGYRVVVLSNQGGINLRPDTKAPKAYQSKLQTFKSKVATVFGQLDIPISIYAATEKDIYRKPRVGMWTEFLEDYGISSNALDIENSVFVGDAGGRHASSGHAKDFSCSDRNFAENVGIKFVTPEEYFLGEPTRPFARDFDPSDYLSDPHAAVTAPYTKKDPCEIVLLCGSPGAGKSTFYWNNLKSLGYARVNQDILKTREKCIKVASEYLANGESVAVDNTNADVACRKQWVALAARHSVPIRLILFTADFQVCEHNDAVRALNDSMNPEKRTILPGMAFKGFASRYQRPSVQEGFQDITEVAFKFIGTSAERGLWTRYWT